MNIYTYNTKSEMEVEQEYPDIVLIPRDQKQATRNATKLIKNFFKVVIT